MVVSFGVARTLRAAAERSGSPALKADSLHYATDLWVNGAALLALSWCVFTGWGRRSAGGAPRGRLRLQQRRLLAEATGDLSDRGLPEEELGRIRSVVAAFAPASSGVHDLKTRRSGGQRFIEFHLEIPRRPSFPEAHDLMVKVLRAVEGEIPRSKVFVHGDPVLGRKLYSPGQGHPAP